jgi:hypothetical protein
MNARTTASRMLGRLDQPHQVARTRPRISPIAQPVRQWRVADSASRVSVSLVCLAFSGRLNCGISCCELLVQVFDADLVRSPVV